jgi:hypothetical protein
MNEDLVRADVLAVAVAMLGNPEAFKQATRVVEHECHIQTDPVQKIAEWSVALVRAMRKEQAKL